MIQGAHIRLSCRDNLKPSALGMSRRREELNRALIPCLNPIALRIARERRALGKLPVCWQKNLGQRTDKEVDPFGVQKEYILRLPNCARFPDDADLSSNFPTTVQSNVFPSPTRAAVQGRVIFQMSTSGPCFSLNLVSFLLTECLCLREVIYVLGQVPTMRRSQSLPPATFWAASRADFSKTAYVPRHATAQQAVRSSNQACLSDLRLEAIAK